MVTVSANTITVSAKNEKKNETTRSLRKTFKRPGPRPVHVNLRMKKPETAVAFLHVRPLATE